MEFIIDFWPYLILVFAIVSVGGYGLFSHAVKHTDGSDDIQTADEAQKGLMSSTHHTDLQTAKNDLDIVEADVVTLEADVVTLEADVVTLEADLDAVESEVETARGSKDSLNERLAELLKAINYRENTTNYIKQNVVAQIIKSGAVNIGASEGDTTSDTTLYYPVSFSELLGFSLAVEEIGYGRYISVSAWGVGNSSLKVVGVRVKTVAGAGTFYIRLIVWGVL